MSGKKGWVFEEIDIARVQLVYDLTQNLNVNDEGMDIVLSLLDQLYGLLSESDIISVHVPATPETHNLVSDDEFMMMKEGVVIINTARGSVIDVKALLRGLNSGKVFGAGLDVLPEEIVLHESTTLINESLTYSHNLETVVADYTLLHHKNVIVTPHSAFYTKEALERILQTTGDNILSFMSVDPHNIVSLKSG